MSGQTWELALIFGNSASSCMWATSGDKQSKNGIIKCSMKSCLMKYLILHNLELHCCLILLCILPSLELCQFHSCGFLVSTQVIAKCLQFYCYYPPYMSPQFMVAYTTQWGPNNPYCYNFKP
jgi:hypothetical protein